MNRARHQFFSSPALARDQHGSIGGTNGLNRVEDFAHGEALSDQFPRTRDFGDGLAQEHILLGCAFVRQRVLHQVRDLVRVKWLGYVVVGAVLQRCDRGLDRGIAGHDNHDKFGVDFVHAALQFDAIGAVHFDIHQGGVPALFRQPGKCVARVFYRGYFVPFFAKPFAQRVAHAQFIVHDQQFSLCAHLNHLTFIATLPVADGRQRSVMRLSRQGDGESRAPAQFRFDFDAPVMPFHDAATDGQSQPDSVSTLFGRKKRFEDLGQYVGSDARSVVAHLDFDFILVVTQPQPRSKDFRPRAWHRWHS